MSNTPIDFSANIERFSGFADLYDHYRPQPPAVLAGLLTRLAKTPFPDLVIDLGSGTGLSTRYWADKARSVIGIEPTADMREQASALTHAANISYRDGLSHQTGLPDACAHIVTCSQSLHWMDPQPTFNEAVRILQKGGVFAAYEYDWPPASGCWEAAQAYEECIRRAALMEQALPMTQDVRRWEKSQHLERMQSSGCFCYTRELALHQIDKGNAERLYGLALSQGGIMTLLKQGVSEIELGLPQLKEILERTLQTEEREWIWCSRLRIGIK